MAGERVLGRADELATIERVIEAFPDGPRAVVLAGEAGIGKTVLWEEAGRRVRERGDLIVLTARASEAEQTLAYVVLTDLLESIAGHAIPTLPRPQADALTGALLIDPAGPAGTTNAANAGDTARARPVTDPRTLGTAVLTTLRMAAAEHPVVLAIDDVQWVDPGSEAALMFALRRASDIPVGLLLTVRTGTPPGPSMPDPLLASVLGERTTALRVGPISLGVLHHLVRDRTGTVLTRQQLVRLETASGGNPLLAIEIARELDRGDRWPMAGEPLPVPSDASGLLGDRLRRLAEHDREILFVVAAMSAPTIDSIAAAMDVEPRKAIDRAVEDGVLGLQPDGRLRFSHPLMAEAALRAVTPVRARRLHALLADHASTVEDRGRHIALAADGRTAAGATIIDAAASSARHRGAASVAAGWAEAAARLTPDDAPAERATRLSRAGQWFAESGEVERGRRLLQEAIAGMPAGDARGAARLALAQTAGWEGGPAAVIRGAEAALSDATDQDLRARIHLRLAGEPDHLGTAVALAHANAAARELDALAAPDPDLLACALLQGAQIRLESGLADDEATVARALALLAAEPRRQPDGSTAAESLRAHAIGWQWAADHDDYATAMVGALADVQRGRDRGMDRPMAIGEAELAYLAAWMGDLADADRHARASVEAADQVGTREARSAALGATGCVAMLTGDLLTATALAREGLSMAADPRDWLDARHEMNLGAAALARGAASEATSVLGKLFDRSVALGSRGSLGFRFAGDLVEGAAAAGQLDRARAVLAVLEEAMRVVPRPWVAVMAARGRALVLAAEGDLDGADDAARAALVESERLPMPFERARTELIAGRIARRRKEKRRAVEHLGRAIDGFRAMGAAAWLTIAEADLARSGRRAVDVDGLTETEDRVARLAAGGLTNREVGEAAFLTAKSVEGVLARVYAKLRIHSRAELGAWLAEQGGVNLTGTRD